jgi:hypothetical protein
MSKRRTRRENKMEKVVEEARKRTYEKRRRIRTGRRRYRSRWRA